MVTIWVGLVGEGNVVGNVKWSYVGKGLVGVGIVLVNVKWSLCR